MDRKTIDFHSFGPSVDSSVYKAILEGALLDGTSMSDNELSPVQFVILAFKSGIDGNEVMGKHYSASEICSFLNGEMNARESVLFAKHIACCKECQAVFYPLECAWWVEKTRANLESDIL